MGRRLPGDRDPVDRLPGPAPIGPRPPRPPFPPVPWTPFGPGDNAVPDPDAISARAEKIRIGLEKTRLELTGMRHGPGPDGAPPVVREVSRADGLWPFLVIRTYPGDMGKRPFEPSDTVVPYSSLVNSPDVFFTPAAPAGGPTVAGRSGIEAIKAQELTNLNTGESYDLWVHVWNLGQFQGSGVRVRARQGPAAYNYPGVPDPPVRSFGGATVDLGDRASDSPHKLVKVATFTTDATGDDYWMLITATAECISDPATGDLAPGADRHSAHCAIEVSS